MIRREMILLGAALLVALAGCDRGASASSDDGEAPPASAGLGLATDDDTNTGDADNGSLSADEDIHNMISETARESIEIDRAVAADNQN